MKTRAATAFALLFALPVLAQDGIKEGNWEFTTQMDGMKMPELPPGMKLPPGMQMPKFGPQGMTYTSCVTKDKVVPQNDKGNEKCTMTKMDRKGNTVTWATTCKTEHGDMTGEGKATYTGDTMNSVTRMKGQAGGEPVDITTTVTGKYLGACGK